MVDTLNAIAHTVRSVDSWNRFSCKLVVIVVARPIVEHLHEIRSLRLRRKRCDIVGGAGDDLQITYNESLSVAVCCLELNSLQSTRGRLASYFTVRAWHALYIYKLMKLSYTVISNGTWHVFRWATASALVVDDANIIDEEMVQIISTNNAEHTERNWHCLRM